jgi:large subunit ribosomal protein L25
MVDVSSNIQATTRVVGKKGLAHKLRKGGLIPAVAYGPGQEPKHLSLEPKRFLLQRAQYGLSYIYDVEVEGQKGFKAFIKNLQRDPISQDVIHVDLYCVDMTKPIRVEVPIEITGKAAGTVDGGIVTQVLRRIEVQCLPDMVPAKLSVDVSSLTIGQSIHTNKMQLPTGVTLTLRRDEVVATCMVPAEEVVETPVAVEGALVEGAVPVEGAAPAEGAEGVAAAPGAPGAAGAKGAPGAAGAKGAPGAAGAKGAPVAAGAKGAPAAAGAKGAPAAAGAKGAPAPAGAKGAPAPAGGKGGKGGKK